MKDLVRSFLNDERGATTTEYAVIAAILVIFAFYGIKPLFIGSEERPPILQTIFVLATDKMANFGGIEQP